MAPGTSHPYPSLFEPIQIGPRTAKNRIWMTGHQTRQVVEHRFTQGHFDYYRERARGGVGVITTEALTVHPTTQLYDGASVFAFDQGIIADYRRLASAVHEFGTLILAQLWHAGRQTTGWVTREPVWAPSAVPCPVNREMPHEMTVAEIDEIVAQYAKSASYAVEGTMDGVEIHGVTHGYLIGQFLSPATNHRQDEYGESFENRLRLLNRIIDAVRDVVPVGFVVGMRISSDEGLEGGLGEADWIQIAQLLARSGKLDYLSVTKGTYQNRHMLIAPTPEPPGYQLEATSKIKQAVGELPVVLVGRIVEPEQADTAISQGHADMVGMARQLMADAEWANKAEAGVADQIRPCVGANFCMASVLRTKLACIHNPAVGRERELGAGTLVAAHAARNVSVVGAGPAGLRAALTAVQRGHNVRLFEKRGIIGGQLTLLRDVEGVAEYTRITEWLVSQLARTSASIELNTEATAEMVGDSDVVIVATGSEPIRAGWSSVHPAAWAADAAPLPGSDRNHVFTVNDVLEGATLSGPVVIFDDTGTRQPLVASEYLAARDHEVHLVTRLASAGADLVDTREWPYAYGRLRRLGITFSANQELASIGPKSVSIRDLHTGELEERAAAAVILSTGNRAENRLLQELERQGHRSVHGVGDCIAPRQIFNAIWEGELAGRAA